MLFRIKDLDPSFSIKFSSKLNKAYFSLQDFPMLSQNSLFLVTYVKNNKKAYR
jgi:hypothetical protein